MKHLLLLTTLSLLPFRQDVKVATWSIGSPDSNGYESLSFWIKDDQRAYVRYLHGKNPDDIELRWLGPDSLDGRRGFRVAFPAPDNRIISILPEGLNLQIIDRNTAAFRKIFQWENENRSGDSTVSCPICAPSAPEAMSWLRKYFMK